jgi:hypothetical protein
MLAGRSSIPPPADKKLHSQTFNIRSLEMTPTVAKDQYSPTQEEGQFTLWQITGRRYRSNWFPIILHSGQSAFFLFLTLGLVLGLA